MFKKIAEEEYEHAHKLIKYQNLRGGRVVFSEVSCPAEQEWSSPLVAIEYALTLEKKVNQVILLCVGIRNNNLNVVSLYIAVCIVIAGLAQNGFQTQRSSSLRLSRRELSARAS